MNQMRQAYVIDNDFQLVRHRVLRNTYWLLALSMIPTILGAWTGVQFNFFGAFFGIFGTHALIGALVSLAIVYGFIFAIRANQESGLGVVLMLAFTFYMGLLLSGIVGFALQNFSNGAELITIAFAGTASILGVMATIATVSKRDFSALGQVTAVGMIMCIIGSLLAIVFHMPLFYLFISVIVIGLSAAYILYQVQQVVNGGERNYISAALGIYISLFNIFVRLLQLLMIFAGGDRR